MRVERYRRSLLLLAAGGVAGGAVVGTLWWPTAVVAAAALVVALRPPSSRIACSTAGLAMVLGVGHPVEQALQPPSYVTVLLVVAVAAVCAVPRPRRELDAALVGAGGTVVIDASAAVGLLPALALVPCVALVVGALWYRQRAMSELDVAVAQAHPPLRLIPVSLAVVGLAMLAAPVPASTGLHLSLFQRHGGPHVGATGEERAGMGSGTLSLDVRGPLGHAPVIAVTAAAPDLWRGAVFSSYDGRTWHAPPGAPPANTVGPGVDAPFPRDPLDPVPPGPAVPVSVRLLGVGAGQVYAPGVITTVTATAPVRLVRRGQAVSGSWDYDESVVLPVTDPDRLAAARGPDPAGWTQLPAELPQRVRDLAVSVTAHAATRPAQVAAVESYLRTHERYTLDAPVPPAGRDDVDAFLFGSHEGFCEQFASAEVVLLRAVGVPARLASGYAYGTVAGSTRVFDQSDAHAWVEVAYSGLGWSPSDPTAGAQILPGRQSLTDRLRAAVSWLGSTPYRRAATAGALAVLGAAVAGLGALAGRRRRRRRVPLGPVAAAFARLERRRPRDPATTPREWIATMSDPELDGALAVWEAELFAPVWPDDAAVRSAV
ncbi:MAG: transglutaminase-like domain-containing protein, partial [Mycobacteriales bacterium]